MDGGNADIAGEIYQSSTQTFADLHLPFASSYRLITISYLNGDLPTEDFHLIS